ncbi:uncharacterized protein LOC110905099 isoform X2 [Helianthus annuus]|uniref:uncharacterized protein LOC110905099 isoform X2 n=1 Tax=Helianthus annuus TaxID=4232 RepID=UPI001652DC23|nr:uncharacterized protein LOC110905099 isoform X2 [Helianthus annuus]
METTKNIPIQTNVGIVERVVLLGAPVAIEDEKREAVRKMVFTVNHGLLSQGLTGIELVDVPEVENVSSVSPYCPFSCIRFGLINLQGGGIVVKA